MTQNSPVSAEAPGWYRVELILMTELFDGWQLFVDGAVIASCGWLLLQAQASGDLTRMAAIRARLYWLRRTGQPE